MPRRFQAGTAGMVFHVLNRGVRRMRLFEAPADYDAFCGTMAEARGRVPLRLLAFCLMPNHFHLVASPNEDGQLAEFMRLLTGTHSKRWNAWRGTTGTGAVYQGRYKAFPIQNGNHFLTVCRYVERNPLRAGLTLRAEGWRWSSLAPPAENCVLPLLESWPVPKPANWVEWVNDAVTDGELEAVRTSVRRSRPFGEATWVERAAGELRLQPSTRRLGRSIRSPGVVVKDL